MIYSPFHLLLTFLSTYMKDRSKTGRKVTKVDRGKVLLKQSTNKTDSYKLNELFKWRLLSLSGHNGSLFFLNKMR